MGSTSSFAGVKSMDDVMDKVEKILGNKPQPEPSFRN
jgi:hypothetical protein